MQERFAELQTELIEGARHQDAYDLGTVNLIAPATPTPLKLFRDIPLRHNAIAEGLLGRRPYAGAEGFNRVEAVAVEAARTLFHAEYANVQPHSVSQANQAVYQGLLENGDRVLAMSFNEGGHLTHGQGNNFSGRFFDFSFYGVGADGLLDYDQIASIAREVEPKLIVCGSSSYPRTIDFDAFGEIARDAGAYLMGDLSHPAGLIVAGRFPQPFPNCDVVTLTLDKTLLGPHGGMILAKEALGKKLDMAVHPGVQSSVPLQRIYQMAQCMLDAGTPWYREYVDRLLRNMKVFESVFSKYPELMVTGGSDTHLMVINTNRVFNLTGKEAEQALEQIGILTNRQVVPGETQKPYIASGIRLGASWITARGYSEEETRAVAEIILQTLENPTNKLLQERSKKILDSILKLKREDDVWRDEE